MARVANFVRNFCRTNSDDIEIARNRYNFSLSGSVQLLHIKINHTEFIDTHGSPHNLHIRIIHFSFSYCQQTEAKYEFPAVLILLFDVLHKISLTKLRYLSGGRL
jgi:hypothetical protein